MSSFCMGSLEHVKLKLSTSTSHPKSCQRHSLKQRSPPAPPNRAHSLLVGLIFVASRIYFLLSTSLLHLGLLKIFPSIEDMQSVFGGTIQKAGEAISSTMSSNKKSANMKPNMRELSAKGPLTSDTGVREPTHDIWLSASTGDRQGPLLLEDNFAREKVIRSSQCCCGWAK